MSQNLFVPFDAEAYFNAIQPDIEKQKLVVFRICREAKIEPKKFTLNSLRCEKYFSYGITRAEIYRKTATGLKVRDWGYWLHLDSWTQEQATCLLYEIDPDKLPKNKSFGEIISDLSEQLIKLYRLAVEKGNMPPSQWKIFALEQGLVIPKPIFAADTMRPAEDELTNQLVEAQSYSTRHDLGVNTWPIKDIRDSEPLQPWWNDARRFARELANTEPRLLDNKQALRKKVAKMLFDIGIKGRGGKVMSEQSLKKPLANFDY